MPLQVLPCRQEYLSAVVDLILAQQERRLRLDPRLHLRTRSQIEARLAMWPQRGEPSLVALDASEGVRGYVQPAVWELSAHSALHAFLSARNGVALDLTLPDPADADASAVAEALLAALSQFWQRQHTSGDLIRWPSADIWIAPQLLAQNFRLDSVCAAHPFQPLTGREHPGSSALVIRPAQPEDEDMVLALFEEELGYHEGYTPFVRRSPLALAAFRRTLSRQWAGQPLAAGGALVLVAELDGQTVAMAEQSLLDLLPDDEPGFTPPGRYGCIDNVCVRESLRGQGIGHLLVHAIEDAFMATCLPLDGYLLWFNPDNPLAGRFWSSMGFVPLWTTYQRLHTASGPV